MARPRIKKNNSASLLDMAKVAESGAVQEPSVYRFPCLQIRQKKHVLYALVAKASEIYRVCRINQRDPDKDEGYQRVLSPARVRIMKEYLLKGLPLANSIVVTFESSARYNASTGTLDVDNKPDAGWVIDGQHRLAGAHEASSSGDIELSVIAFLDLPLMEQIQQFVIINREAKGVPSSLYLDLLRNLPPATTDAEAANERATDIFKELAKDEYSPLYNRIAYTTARRGQISLTNFARKVAPMLRQQGVKAKFSVYSLYEQKAIIDNYFKALRNVFPKAVEGNDAILFRTLGFGAMINALSFVFDVCVRKHAGFRVEDISSILKLVEDFEFQSWVGYGSGTEAEKRAADDFEASLSARLRPADGEDQTAARLKL